MIICIESWKGDVYLSGKRIPIAELRTQIRAAEELYDRSEDNFVPLLCRMYTWETAVPTGNLVPDITYDRDTGLIF